MFKRHTFVATLTVGALLTSGCANHLPQRSEHEERIERRVLSQNLLIDVGESKELVHAQREIRIHEQQSVEVKHFEVTRRYDRYTPYQAWRELYEVPLGMVAIVAGTGANILNVLMFGSLPSSATRDWISYGVAGLNPAMNIESNGRSQQNLAHIEEKQLEQRVEYLSLPWSERTVRVSAAGQAHELSTDRTGVLHVNLLDSPFAEQEDLSRAATLRIAVDYPHQPQPVIETLTLGKTLRQSLREAHHLVFDNLEDNDVDEWVYRVKRLAELGFENEAIELEQSIIELSRNDPQLQQDFAEQLLKVTGRIAKDPGMSD